MDDKRHDRLMAVVAAIEGGEALEWTTFEQQPAVRVPIKRGTRLVMLAEGDRDAIDELVETRRTVVMEAEELQANPPEPLTADERATLRALDVVSFEGRFITKAEPAITDEWLAEINSRLLGPVPEDLAALWLTCFGGEIAYDLHARFEGIDDPLPFSFTELYFPGSKHYRDLAGWMDHELELAQEAADERGAPIPEKLEYLPFGGFEYLERIYVKLVPDADHGSVWGWRKALPPAWEGALKVDAATRLADDVRSMWRMLHVAPGSVVDRYSRMATFQHTIDRVRDAHGPALAERVRSIYVATRPGR